MNMEALKKAFDLATSNSTKPMTFERFVAAQDLIVVAQKELAKKNIKNKTKKK